jgi:RNA polymerase sigma-70 factor (ECF subfamily)
VSGPELRSAFPVTRWSAVMSIRDDSTGDESERILDELCQDYWQPLYCFARRMGYDAHEAEDLTQGFFSYLLEKRLFASADPETGRLRTFLLTTFRRYVGDVQDRAHAAKRGGGREIVSLDVAFGEEEYAREPSDGVTPEMIFERTWAMAVLRHAFEALSEQEQAAGRGQQLAILEPFLVLGGDPSDGYKKVAEELGQTEAATRQVVTRLRAKLRDCLRRHIADTLRYPTDEQIEEELLSLRNALVE